MVIAIGMYVHNGTHMQTLLNAKIYVCMYVGTSFCLLNTDDLINAIKTFKFMYV